MIITETWSEKLFCNENSVSDRIQRFKDYKIILCIDLSVWKELSDYDQYSFARHAFDSLFKDEYESQKFYTFMLLIVKHSSISFSLTRLIIIIHWQWILDINQKDKLTKATDEIFIFSIKETLSNNYQSIIKALSNNDIRRGIKSTNNTLWSINCTQ